MDNQKFICENCGLEHNRSYGSGRFCSEKCAKSYSTKNESKKLKEANCIICGRKIHINKRASTKTCKCEKCQKLHHKPSDLKICKICGKKYYKQDGCSNQFCKNHNLNGFKLLIQYFGFDESKLGTIEVENEFLRIKNLIHNLYWKDNLSSKDIAEKFNFKSKHSLIQTVFKFLDIPSRNFKQSTSNAYYTRKMCSILKNQYKSEWHTTWNGKEVYLRSSFESDYAKELDANEIDYDVEYLRIKYFNTNKNEYRCAIPDFYLPETNTIVEIKSNWTLNIQEMKDKKKAYLEQGYNFKLILDHKEIDLPL